MGHETDTGNNRLGRVTEKSRAVPSAPPLGVSCAAAPASLLEDSQRETGLQLTASVHFREGECVWLCCCWLS